MSENHINVNGSVDKYRRIRPAYFWYACKETSPGIYKVFYHAEFVESEEWTEIPFERLLVDINNHIMQYAQMMAKED